MLARRFNESRCLGVSSGSGGVGTNSRGGGGGDSSRLADQFRRRRLPYGTGPETHGGLHLVRQYGCFGCHEIPALRDVKHKVGPSLRNIAGKFDADYLARRIRNPADVLPTTRMPRLYGLDEHLSGRVLAETRRSEEAEIRAVVEYLLASAEKVEPPAPPHATRRLRSSAAGGCLKCRAVWHVIGIGIFRRGKRFRGPTCRTSAGIICRAAAVSWLTGWIADPARYSPQTLMPNPLLQPTPLDDGKTADPAADLAAYLMGRRRAGHFSAQWRERKSAVGSRQSAVDRDFARRTIARRGCAGCHDIPGLENAPPIGPTLAGWARKPESMLAFERINDFLEKPLAVSQATIKVRRSHRNDQTISSPTRCWRIAARALCGRNCGRRGASTTRLRTANRSTNNSRWAASS